MLLQAAATTTQNVGSPITAYWPVMVFFAVAVIFPVLPIVLGRFLRPIKYEKDKMRRLGQDSIIPHRVKYKKLTR